MSRGVSVKYNPLGSYQIGDDFDLGDIISVETKSGLYDAQIVKIKCKYQSVNIPTINLVLDFDIDDSIIASITAKHIDYDALVAREGGGGGSTSADGWIVASETWTYSNVDNPTGIFTINGDVTAKYSEGMRLKFTNNGNIIYGIICLKPSYSSPNTTITFLHEIDPTDTTTSGTTTTTAYARDIMTNNTISDNYYSTAKVPFGFPPSHDSWRVKYIDTNYLIVKNPVGGVYYNVCSGSIPVGTWNIKGQAVGFGTASAAEGIRIALSTTNSSATDTELIALTQGHVIHSTTEFLERDLSLSTKTTYYINASAASSGMTYLRVRGDQGDNKIIATCLYI